MQPENAEDPTVFTSAPEMDVSVVQPSNAPSAISVHPSFTVYSPPANALVTEMSVVPSLLYRMPSASAGTTSVCSTTSSWPCAFVRHSCP